MALLFFPVLHNQPFTVMKNQKDTRSNQRENTNRRDQNMMSGEDSTQKADMNLRNQPESIGQEPGSLENQNRQEPDMSRSEHRSAPGRQPLGNESIGDDDLNDEMLNLEDEDDSFDR